MIKKKKETLLKQINVLSDIMWLCAGVLVTDDWNSFSDPVQYFLTEGVRKPLFIEPHHDFL